MLLWLVICAVDLHSKSVEIPTVKLNQGKKVKMCAHGELRAQAGEVKAMKNAMIRYILNVAPKKTPFKSIDIVKQCLRGEQKWFVQLFPEVQEALNDVSIQLNPSHSIGSLN